MHIEEACELMCLPQDIAAVYSKAGVKVLYAWQAECLQSTGVSKGQNLVYCAPTSGGKTLISELALLKASISLRKKAIFVLPFVSLVIEKETYMKTILRKKWNQGKAAKDRIRARGSVLSYPIIMFVSIRKIVLRLSW